MVKKLEPKITVTCVDCRHQFKVWQKDQPLPKHNLPSKPGITCTGSNRQGIIIKPV
jgi:hypothetical protein